MGTRTPPGTPSPILRFHVTSRRPCWCTEQYRKKSFGNLILLLSENLSDILPLFCTSIRPSYHMSENQEFAGIQQCRELPYMGGRVVCTGHANAAQKTNTMQLMIFSHMVSSLISDTLHFGWVNDSINAPGGVYTCIIIRLIVTCAICIFKRRRYVCCNCACSKVKGTLSELKSKIIGVM